VLVVGELRILPVTGKRQEPKPGHQPKAFQLFCNWLDSVRVRSICFDAIKSPRRAVAFLPVLPLIVDLNKREAKWFELTSRNLRQFHNRAFVRRTTVRIRIPGAITIDLRMQPDSVPMGYCVCKK